MKSDPRRYKGLKARAMQIPWYRWLHRIQTGSRNRAKNHHSYLGSTRLWTLSISCWHLWPHFHQAAAVFATFWVSGKEVSVAVCAANLKAFVWGASRNTPTKIAGILDLQCRVIHCVTSVFYHFKKASVQTCTPAKLEPIAPHQCVTCYRGLCSFFITPTQATFRLICMDVLRCFWNGSPQ